MKKQNIFLTFIIPIIAVIALLVVQALCDLELPSYTSDIINNGIQQGGIDNTLPEVLTTKMFNGIAKISKESSAIMASYDLFVSENLSNQDLEELGKQYPLIKEEDLYLLNDLTEEERKIVEEEIKVPLLITTMLYTNNENIAKSLNLQIPEGSTLLDEVLKLDEETFNTVISSIEQSIKSMDNMVLDQYAISGIKSIYNEIVWIWTISNKLYYK